MSKNYLGHSGEEPDDAGDDAKRLAIETYHGTLLTILKYLYAHHREECAFFDGYAIPSSVRIEEIAGYVECIRAHLEYTGNGTCSFCLKVRTQHDTRERTDLYDQKERTQRVYRLDDRVTQHILSLLTELDREALARFARDDLLSQADRTAAPKRRELMCAAAEHGYERVRQGNIPQSIAAPLAPDWMLRRISEQCYQEMKFQLVESILGVRKELLAYFEYDTLRDKAVMTDSCMIRVVARLSENLMEVFTSINVVLTVEEGERQMHEVNDLGTHVRMSTLSVNVHPDIVREAIQRLDPETRLTLANAVYYDGLDEAEATGQYSDRHVKAVEHLATVISESVAHDEHVAVVGHAQISEELQDEIDDHSAL